jgi:hypothetical protein
MTTEATDRQHTWQPTGLVIENEISITEEVCTTCGAARLGELGTSGSIPALCHGSRARYAQWQREKLERENRCEIFQGMAD